MSGTLGGSGEAWVPPYERTSAPKPAAKRKSSTDVVLHKPAPRPPSGGTITGEIVPGSTIVHKPKHKSVVKSAVKSGVKSTVEGTIAEPEGGELLGVKGAVTGARDARKANKQANRDYRRAKQASTDVIAGGRGSDGGAVIGGGSGRGRGPVGGALRKIGNMNVNGNLVPICFIASALMIIISYLSQAKVSGATGTTATADGDADSNDADMVSLMKRLVALIVLYIVLGLANAGGATGRKISGGLAILVTLTLATKAMVDVEAVVHLLDPAKTGTAATDQSGPAGLTPNGTRSAATDGPDSVGASIAGLLRPDVNSNGGFTDGSSGFTGGGLNPDGSSSRLAGRTNR